MYGAICRSNHSGNNGSSGSLPSSGGGGNGANGVSSMNSDDGNNGEYFNNNHGAGGDNSLGSEVCDVPYEVANQKRHVSTTQHICMSNYLYFCRAVEYYFVYSVYWHSTYLEVNRFPKS